MNTKLILTIDKAIIEKAKRYAKDSGRSLSELIEAYLRELTSGKETRVPHEFEGLYGAVALPEGFDEKQEIRLLRNKKHQCSPILVLSGVCTSLE